MFVEQNQYHDPLNKFIQHLSSLQEPLSNNRNAIKYNRYQDSMNNKSIEQSRWQDPLCYKQIRSQDKWISTLFE